MSYRTVAGISAFLIISFLTMVPGGGSEVLFDVNMSQEDLSIEPNIPDSELQDVDIESAVETENITFVDTENYFNGSQDYNTSKAAVVSEGSTTGKLVYEVSEYERISLLSTQAGFLIGDSGVDIQFQPDGTSYGAAGQSDFNMPDNTQDAVITLDDDAGGVLYSVSLAENEETGALTTSFQWIFSIASYPLKLWALFSAFPWYIQTFYGMLIAYMVVDILQVG